MKIKKAPGAATNTHYAEVEGIRFTNYPSVHHEMHKVLLLFTSDYAGETLSLSNTAGGFTVPFQYVEAIVDHVREQGESQ